MTQDERWQKQYEEVAGFIEVNKRNPSKYVTCSFLWHKERSFIPYFLWRKERSKETSTYPKSFLRPGGSKRQSRAPYMEGLNRRMAETAHSSTVLVSRDAR